MSTHYSVASTNIIVDGVGYPLDQANISIAFGGDMWHPYMISFTREANKAAKEAIRKGCIVEFDRIKGVVEAVNINQFMVVGINDDLVTVGVGMLRAMGE